VRAISSESRDEDGRDEAVTALGEIIAESACVATLNQREELRQLHGDLFSPGLRCEAPGYRKVQGVRRNRSTC